MRFATLLRSTVVVAAASLGPTPARADSCAEFLGGLIRSSGCGPRTPVMFRAGAVEDAPRPLIRNIYPPDRRIPQAMPLPVPSTRSGPTTLKDLELRPDGSGGYRGRRPGFQFHIQPDGSIQFHDRPSVNLGAFLLVGMVGFFDLTDALMRLHGEDPYRYDKALVSSLTRPMREQLTDADRQRRVDRALRRLPRDLEALWGRADLSAADRRELLFRLWDETLDGTDGEVLPRAGAESGPEAEAAVSARRAILEFIQIRLPTGSAEGYTAEELARLNAQRRSRAPFAP